MKIKFKTISVTVSILISTTCFAQSEGVPQEIQNILIGRWVPTEKVCLQSELNGIGNLIRKRDNYLSGNYWLLKTEDIKNIEPVLVRKYEITSGRIVDENKKIYEIKGIETVVADNIKFQFVQVFKLVNNFTRTTIDYILDNKVLIQNGVNITTNKTNQLINCESIEMVALQNEKFRSNELLAKKQENELVEKQYLERKNIRTIKETALASRQLKISNMSEPELISRRYTLESEKTSSTSDVSEIENELQMVNQQLDKIELERKNNRQNQIQNAQKPSDKPLTEKQKKEMEKRDRELANAFINLLGSALQQDRKNEVRTNAGWCVNAQGIGESRITSITTNSGGFQINTQRTGSSGGSTINCNHSQNHRSNWFTAQCYRC